jgi:predicted Na+-dependent transporter
LVYQPISVAHNFFQQASIQNNTNQYNKKGNVIMPISKKLSMAPPKLMQCLAGFLLTAVIFSMTFASTAGAGTGIELYKYLSRVAKGNENPRLFEILTQQSRQLNWDNASTTEFKGNLRLLKSNLLTGSKDQKELYFVRDLDGKIFLLSVPQKEDTKYHDLHKMTDNKMIFKLRTIIFELNGRTYEFCRFIEKPEQALLDRIFKLSIILMLFFVMVGMGLTLTFKDFALVFTKPKGVLIGEILQFGFMPLLALGLGYLLGFHANYPFVFVGMILITATPGGVTSNLMTHYAKGDVALSISLTSLSTILSIFFLPLLLNAYCSNIPDINIPVKTIISTIIVLVLIPLVVGMSVRFKWELFAEKSVPFFSALGLVALLFLIGGGIMSNFEKFYDTERYGVLFYSIVLIMTFSGMFFGAVIPKLFGISNYQVRAISLETGLRNAALAMTVALLIQDAMGDFYSSMFFVSGIFGLTMYLAGIISIKMYKTALPVEENDFIEK